MDSIQDHLKEHGLALPTLADQLREVVLQSEQATVTLNEKFMNITSRARKQLAAAAEMVEQLAASAPGPAAGASARDVEGRLAWVRAETKSLAADIEGIIMALQYQDITRQQIERVIKELRRLQGEIESLKQAGGA